MTDPALRLSEHSITLAKNASEMTIEVTTNQKDWDIMTNTGWIELTKSGTTLTVKAQENPLTVARKAEVMVNAGGATATLSVEQAGSDVIIVTIPDALEVNPWGGEFKFYVDANTNNWDAICDVDWLTMTTRQFNNELLINIDEISVREDRVATITLFGDGYKGAKNILIKQSGVLYHILPYMEIKTSFADIIAFEEARCSFFKNDFMWVLKNYLTFDTKSEAFPTIEYKLNENYLLQVVLYSSSPEVVEDPMLDVVFRNDGFESTTDNVYMKNVTYGGEDFIIRADVVPKGIAFNYIPKQPKAMPTFETLPFGFLDFSDTGTLERIKDWESENGGTYSHSLSAPHLSSYRFLIAPDSNNPTPLERNYWLKDSTLVQVSHFFENPELLCYKVRNVNYLTQEFENLLIRSGYVKYLGTSVGFRIYTGPNIEFPLYIGFKKYNDVNKAKTVLEVRFLHTAINEEEIDMNNLEHFILPDFRKNELNMYNSEISRTSQ